MNATTKNQLNKSALLQNIRDGKLPVDDALAMLRQAKKTSVHTQSFTRWQDQFLHEFTTLVAQLLRIDDKDIDLDMAVTDMGLDSLSATELNNHMRRQFGLSLQATAFFECNTLREFHQYMLRLFGDTLKDYYHQLHQTPTAVTNQQQSNKHQQPQKQVQNPPQIAAKSLPGLQQKQDPIRENLKRLWAETLTELPPINTSAIPPSSPFEHILLQSNNRPAIEVCIAGKGQPLLLLGGLMNPEGIWKKQLKSLTENHRVIAFNKPGCGRSEVDSKNFSMNNIVDSVYHVLDLLNINETLPVIGFSFGGMVAQQLAVQHPELFTSLILINTTAKVCPNEKDIQILRQELALCPEVIDINGNIDMALAAHYKKVSADFDMTERLADIKTQTLVLAATDDQYITTAQSKALAAGLNNAQYTEIGPNAGHFSLLTHADEINKHLCDFLTSPAILENVA